ncbi:hypothetical protein [Sedimentitalea nanhaiensis]|uniref:Uncharacterized protein n=1 Tax=Sedimentitalea nanhaiensis TaxID=999627 RepID=A0A1I6ZLG8_9RHOB|nr:hypothetical protein [Sedimentitalea nanhaiensis]SFT63511.1 hypothetical protein SAMN05216236_104185 [Sedimentitalea nanhaiensis]
MSLAQNIQTADTDELTALARYLTDEFAMQETNPLDGAEKPAEPTNVAAALSAWAYMQLNAQDQGD